MRKNYRPHIITEIYFDSGTVEVSSVNYDESNMHLNETCVFYPDDKSEVLGTYDDHFKIVKDILENFNK
jgi:hypothetical protein